MKKSQLLTQLNETTISYCNQYHDCNECELYHESELSSCIVIKILSLIAAERRKNEVLG